jgi:hypothetical protein
METSIAGATITGHNIQQLLFHIGTLLPVVDICDYRGLPYPPPARQKKRGGIVVNVCRDKPIIYYVWCPPSRKSSGTAR